jgi:uncharacterized repeat protein (TIGR02543 family)
VTTTQPVLYTISFYTFGGTELNSLSVLPNSAGGNLPIPTKEGYTFLGWFYGTDFITPYNPDQVVVNSFTVYASWELDKSDLYTVSYILLDEVEVNQLFVSTVDYFNNQVFLLGNNRLYGFGENWRGQMGDGTLSDINQPTNLTHNIPLNDNEVIIQIASGGEFTLALTSDNRLFGWGDNSYFQLGSLVAGDLVYSPTEITDVVGLNPGEKVMMIRAGISSSYVVTDHNRVIAWGRNTYGELGNNTTVSTGVSQDITSHFNLLNGETIIDIQCGNNFVISYTSLNRVFTWGSNFKGQLGTNNYINTSIPIEITSSFDFLPYEKITAIGTGYQQAYLATSRSRVYGWGSNDYNQFCLNSATILYPTLFLVIMLYQLVGGFSRQLW